MTRITASTDKKVQGSHPPPSTPHITFSSANSNYRLTSIIPRFSIIAANQGRKWRRGKGDFAPSPEQLSNSAGTVAKWDWVSVLDNSQLNNRLTQLLSIFYILYEKYRHTLPRINVTLPEKILIYTLHQTHIVRSQFQSPIFVEGFIKPFTCTCFFFSGPPFVPFRSVPFCGPQSMTALLVNISLAINNLIKSFPLL